MDIKLYNELDDGEILQFDMSLPEIPDLVIKEDNIITKIFDNCNMNDFNITDV